MRKISRREQLLFLGALIVLLLVPLIVFLVFVPLGTGPRETVYIFAVTPVGEPIEAIAAAFREQENVNWNLTIDSYERLAEKISRGARVDVLVAADLASVSNMIEFGQFAKTESQTFEIGIPHTVGDQALATRFISFAAGQVAILNRYGFRMP